MNVKIRRALFSVSDKAELTDLARYLSGLGVEIIATGGTADSLKAAGILFTPIETLTGNPEAFGGRMKTLSFPFLSALLFRRDNPEDQKTAKGLNIEPIDLVVCNFYPFEATMKANATDPELVEKIDIGGPTMVRAAAKNFAHVTVCTNPAQYKDLRQELERNSGATSISLRQEFAVAAFALTAHYESVIAEELSRRFSDKKVKYLRLEQGNQMRYGENPHQSATLYHWQDSSHSIANAKVLQGKALSYNNLLDADAAHRVTSDIAMLEPVPSVVSVIKHSNPCGLAMAATPLEALQLAWAGDPVSAFGGILCFSSPVDKPITDWLEDKFIEVLIAPEFSQEALLALGKKKNLRVLQLGMKRPSKEQMLRSVSGGLLIQDEDEGLDEQFTAVTKKAIPESIRKLGQFAVLAAKHLKSNAIALAHAPSADSWQLVGAGMGQPNRVDSLRLLAGPRAKEKTSLANCILASDAFFPFPDIVEVAAEMGLRYLLQPGGSLRDQEVIEACDRLGIAMAFTGRRHFRH